MQAVRADNEQHEVAIAVVRDLVETVKGYASHEKSTFESVVEARNRAMQATTPEAKAEAENFLQSTLKSLFALSEAYPDLKANQNFLELQAETNVRSTAPDVRPPLSSLTTSIIPHEQSLHILCWNHAPRIRQRYCGKCRPHRVRPRALWG